MKNTQIAAAIATITRVVGTLEREASCEGTTNLKERYEQEKQDHADSLADLNRRFVDVVKGSDQMFKERNDTQSAINAIKAELAELKRMNHYLREANIHMNNVVGRVQDACKG